MEEPCEIHSEDNKSLPDKDKNKRKLKTPYQVESLEKFYSEHKYPTEQMKAQMAETIGLTEKQVSGWFCHRRLKDKRLSVGETYDNLRQDRSSGVIQDRGSGHRQDSCGSRQEGDNNRHFDLKEVESKRFSVADCIPKHMIDNEEDDTDMDDDTSSGGSMPLQHRYLPNNPKPLSSMEASRYIRHSKNVVPGDSMKMKVNRPSGYLKMKVPVENPAITAVKRQLDRQYRADGPPLGVDFDSLPPGAFESSTLNTANEYDEPEDQLTPKTEYLETNKQPESGMRHETYNCKMNFQNMELDRTRPKFIQGSDYEDCYNSSKSAKPKNLSHNISSFSGKSSSSQGVEAYYSGDISPYEDRNPDRMRIQIHKERRMNSLPDNYVHPYNEKMVYAKTEPSFSQKDGPNPKRPFIPTNGVPLGMEDRKASRKMNKAIKRDHDDHPQHQRKASSSSKTPAWISMPKRSAADQVPSSFSEDETALTSSS
ncbi:uncharacterized protein LOC124935870 [Impatiens glandulifera]|uniref:uncharacterized protein LOC124935870 n=1 Tax=Impatiens glandulifera TaxID=253017 RepID=UPI001FB15CF8|nr:uncharacterized protein LOC124935870 [Impatiens glandulifera]